uniref:CCHC-type domain-containing protein n=1 Tax=Tetradesmus obliquus TaxID=3088 RepID=A0A383VNT7_TETOB|eukprot:jgi/Sobl393_1/19736/SZX66076.1
MFTLVKPDYDARNKLDRLMQTRSVFDYASRFNTLMLELPNMDEADRVHFFIKGLKPEIRMHRQRVDSGPTPMELGSMEPEEGGQAELHYVQGKRKAIKCFYCQRAGHRIADCRQRKIDEQRDRRAQPFKPPTQQQRQQFQSKEGKPPSRRSTN